MLCYNYKRYIPHVIRLSFRLSNFSIICVIWWYGFHITQDVSYSEHLYLPMLLHPASGVARISCEEGHETQK